MKELITLNQANQLMYVVLVAAPVIGLVWGAATKRIKHGLIAGLLIGLANLALWKVYNGITDKLGLDTVKNLLVNLALFIAVGLIAGMIWGWAVKPKNDSV
jgi:drug/metabolite transporter (DMT)-like permease